VSPRWVRGGEEEKEEEEEEEEELYLTCVSQVGQRVTRVRIFQLKVNPPINISRDDWDVMTQGESLTTESGELHALHFDQVMRRQLKLYVQRQLANAMEVSAAESNYHCTSLFVLKVLSVGMDEIHNALQIPIAAKGSGYLNGSSSGDGGGHGAAARSNSAKLWPATTDKAAESASEDEGKRDWRAVSSREGRRRGGGGGGLGGGESGGGGGERFM